MYILVLNLAISVKQIIFFTSYKRSNLTIFKGSTRQNPLQHCYFALTKDLIVKFNLFHFRLEMTNDDWGTPAASADGWGSGATASGWGGGGDAGGDRKKGCFKCGQEGHNKADCPQPDVKRACFNCGQEGHNKQDCPNPPKARY